MDTYCAECKQHCTPTDDCFKCNGSCGNFYHLSCLSRRNKYYKKSVVAVLSQIPNMLWYCNNCLPYTLENALGGLMRRLYMCADIVERIINPLQYQLNASVSASQSQLMCAQQQQQQLIQPTQPTSQQTASATENGTRDNNPLPNIAAGETNGMRDSAELANVSMECIETIETTDAHSIHQPSAASNKNCPTQDNRKRKLDGTQSPKRRKIENGSSQSTMALSQMVILPAKSPENRSIYITQFKPSTSTDQIIGHLRSRIKTRKLVNKIKCTKLMSDRKNPKKLHFVSFKIDVPSEYFEQFIDPSIWPAGITAKEFSVNQSSNNATSSKIKQSKQSNQSKVVPKNRKRASTQRGQRNRTQMEGYPPMNIFPMTNYPLIPFQSTQPPPCYIPNTIHHPSFQPYLNRL